MKNNKLEIGLGVVVLTITIIFLAMVFMSGGADFYIKILIVFAAVLLGAVVYIWKLLKKRKDIKSGVTVEDEFTEIVTLYAGKKAFMGSMYLWFFIYIYKNLFGDIGNLLGFGILGSVLIYGFYIWYYKSTGKFDEK